MNDIPCSVCNTIRGIEYEVINGEKRYACSDKCLQIIKEMKDVYETIRFISIRYGPSVPMDEIPYLLQGRIKIGRVRWHIKTLIKEKYVVKKDGSYVEIIKPSQAHTPPTIFRRKSPTE